MTKPIKTRYVDGAFRPLTHVNLPNGKEVTIRLSSDQHDNDLVMVGKKHFFEMLSQLKATTK